MSELSPETRALLASLDGAYDPPDGAAARVREALGARLAAPPKPRRWPWVGGGVVVVGLGVASLLRPAPAPPPAPAAVVTAPPPAPAAVVTPPPAPAESPAPPAAVTAPTAAPPPAAPPPPPTRPRAARPPEAARDDLLGELRLIQRAQRALGRGDSADALAALSQHARVYPSGRMLEEREAARVLALCAAGRAEDARGASSRFVARFPSSPQVARVRGACR